MSAPKKKIIAWVAICLFIGILVAVVIPNFIKARHATAANVLINDLRQTNAATTK